MDKNYGNVCVRKSSSIIHQARMMYIKTTKPSRPSNFFLNRSLVSILSALLSVLLPMMAIASEIRIPNTDFSGYLKSFNFFTRTSNYSPEWVDNPLAREKEWLGVFSNNERFRLKVRTTASISENQRVMAKIDYDHQAYFGTYAAKGDFRIAHRQSEQRQFLDLSQTLVEDNNAYYEHRLYRASLAYQADGLSVEVGRQQIPWGVCYFFTPTDLFNPFNPTQIELDERDGVDAANLILENIRGYKIQAVYTPPGKQLHPQRYLARVSRDVKGYEIGLLGGRDKRDHAFGFDLAGNLKDSSVRGEFLYREAELEKDFIKFAVNADYNFPGNVYGLLEYYFNGQGRRNRDAYQIDRLIRGDIQQLSKNYLGLMLGYDLTPLWRIENRTILNLDDLSFFIRPELRYEMKTNLLFTLGAQLFAGDREDEFGSPKHLFFGEAKYNF